MPNMVRTTRFEKAEIVSWGTEPRFHVCVFLDGACYGLMTDFETPEQATHTLLRIYERGEIDLDNWVNQSEPEDFDWAEAAQDDLERRASRPPVRARDWSEGYSF